MIGILVVVVLLTLAAAVIAGTRRFDAVRRWTRSRGGALGRAVGIAIFIISIVEKLAFAGSFQGNWTFQANNGAPAVNFVLTGPGRVAYRECGSGGQVSVIWLQETSAGLWWDASVLPAGKTFCYAAFTSASPILLQVGGATIASLEVTALSSAFPAKSAAQLNPMVLRLGSSDAGTLARAIAAEGRVASASEVVQLESLMSTLELTSD